MTYHACTRTRARGVGVVHNSEIDTFADAGIRISVGHVWLLSVLFQLACGTRRGRNPGTKKGAPFPTRLRLGLGVVLSWIFPCFCLLEIPVQYLLEGVKVLFPERLEN